MSLDEYRRRRDFARTREPGAGKAGRGAGGTRRFVIQLHHARARHFDFRLEHAGVLRSWAVPKGPSLRPADKRLAVEVEDHPLAYGGFEGEIPEGEYGAGHVRIVEEGEWFPEGDAEAALAAGKLDFRLQGRVLAGAWTLVRTGPPGRKAKWLLIKREDEYVRDADLDQLVHEQDTQPWAERALALPGAVLGRPEPSPQFATLRTAAPDGDGWLHEIKWDGYRLLATVEGGRVRLQSRNSVDWSGRFPEIERALRALPVRSLLLDAELVALDEGGYSDFARLQRALDGTEPNPVSAIAFDLLWLDGVDVSGCAQLARKALLEQLLRAAPDPWLAYGRHIVGHGPRVLAKALASGYEGIVSKRVDAAYAPGRGQQWIKVKRRDAFEAVVVGYTRPRGSRAGLGALLLAVAEPAGFRYVGRVGTGMDERMLRDLAGKLLPLETGKPAVPLPAHVPLPAKSVTWVRPRLVVEVEHRGWGRHGLLRQASFMRLRSDKSVANVTPAAIPTLPPLSHPDRVVYPRPRITKRRVAEYYQAVAPWMLQELAGRPVSVLRAPDGIGGELFFQKHFSGRLGAGVESLPVKEKSGRTRPYLCLRDAEGLLALVQLNALEFHPWGVLPGEPDRPDRITFDLDPGEGVRWAAMVAAAEGIRDQLADAGLASHALLSGGKGVHVVVPLSGRDRWPAVKRFAHSLAKVWAEHDPDAYVAVARKSERRGRIFIDWLRNGRGATSIAPWSLRARPRAPVAMPVSWSDLAASRSADQFRLDDALAATRALAGHPWGDYRTRPQSLPGSAGSG